MNEFYSKIMVEKCVDQWVQTRRAHCQTVAYTECGDRETLHQFKCVELKKRSKDYNNVDELYCLTIWKTFSGSQATANTATTHTSRR